MFRKVALSIWVIILLPLCAATTFIFWELSNLLITRETVSSILPTQVSIDEICEQVQQLPPLHALDNYLIEQSAKSELVRLCKKYDNRKSFSSTDQIAAAFVANDAAFIETKKMLQQNAERLEQTLNEINATQGLLTPLRESAGRILGLNFNTSQTCELDGKFGLPKSEYSAEVLTTNIETLRKSDSDTLAGITAEMAPLMVKCQALLHEQQKLAVEKKNDISAVYQVLESQIREKLQEYANSLMVKIINKA